MAAGLVDLSLLKVVVPTIQCSESFPVCRDGPICLMFILCSLSEVQNDVGLGLEIVSIFVAMRLFSF